MAGLNERNSTMQASNVLPYWCCTTPSPRPALSVAQRSNKIAITAILVLMASSVPEAGLTPTTEIAPLSDSYVDLSLSDVVERFQARLAPAEKKDAYKLGRLVLELSDRHQFSPTFILSMIETESSFRTDVVSKAGAVGLMQLLPGTAAEIAERYGIRSYKSAADLRNPVVNLKLGVAYLSQLRKQFGHSLHYVAAYNLGPTAMRKKLRNGNYELGALDRYVRVVHERSRLMRVGHSLQKSPAVRRGDALMSAAL
jgi:hypothetical protein